MRRPRDTYPLELCLPNEARAQLVPGSAKAGQPRYTLDGAPIEVDVRVPPDLAGRWYWSGTLLVEINADGDEQRLLLIDSGTFGVPGVFDAARKSEAAGARIKALAAQLAAKKARKAKPAQAVAHAEPTQLAMEL
jgi:hypothetical protein